MHELRVAYELLLDAKRHKLRIADVVLALQDCSRTPPAAGSSPRILGEWGGKEGRAGVWVWGWEGRKKGEGE